MAETSFSHTQVPSLPGMAHWLVPGCLDHQASHIHVDHKQESPPKSQRFRPHGFQVAQSSRDQGISGRWSQEATPNGTHPKRAGPTSADHLEGH